MDKIENQARADELARDILKLARNTLLVNLRFLDMALSQFTYINDKTDTIATDGEHIFYAPAYILHTYKAHKEAPTREYLHMVMHCVFRHGFVHGLLVDRELWDLACDVAVENAINDLKLPSVDDGREARQQKYIDSLKPKLRRITAETLYAFFRDEQLTPGQIETLSELFRADDHDNWYEISLVIENTVTSSDSEEANGSGSAGGRAELEAAWKDIAERMQIDMETFQKQRGDKAGALIQNLREVNREKYDYSAFLRRFAVLGEAMKINQDEFDYVFYTYGLKLYDKMPLIEPLEYKDVRRIREFVIAIDTSGSVSGEPVQTFLQKTYNILKQEESYFRRFNLHIIQCDATIQEDAKITNREELDNYIKTMQIHGLGGTDFRPVFSYVDYLREKKELTNLRGLIYFTDGCGIFPEKMPDYSTAFVFIDDNLNNYEVPPWAIKLVLQSGDI